MKSLKNLIEKRKIITKKNLEDRDVFQVFREVIRDEYGNQGVEKFQPDFFKDKKIFIRCTSSAWANELYLNERKIIDLMNIKLGGGSVGKIKIK
jgi:hypothetical protein